MDAWTHSRERPASVRRSLWLLAVAAFGVGDVGLTLFGLWSGIAVEAHPLAARVVGASGALVLVPWKAAVIALFFAVYRAVPDGPDVGVPIGLAVHGSVVVAWNVWVLSLAVP